MVDKTESLKTFRCQTCEGAFQSKKEIEARDLICPHCRGEMYPRAVQGEGGINAYARYRCISCAHVDMVTSKKRDYEEVMPCPKCSSFFVDEWAIGKYRLPTFKKE